MSKSDARKGYPFEPEREPPVVLILGQKRSNTSMTDHTEFPGSYRTNTDEMARSVALLTNQVAILKRRLLTYEDTFNQLFELLSSSDKKVAKLEQLAYVQQQLNFRGRRNNSSLEELDQCADFLHPSSTFIYSESATAGKSRTSRQSIEIMKNSLTINSRQVEQALQRLEALESLSISSRLDQLESAVDAEVKILKMLEQEIYSINAPKTITSKQKDERRSNSSPRKVVRKGSTQQRSSRRAQRQHHA